MSAVGDLEDLMLRIGDFSRLSQVSVKALRFYDEIGLLRPTYVDRFTGYRYYAPALLSSLNRILVLKDLGFSLDEIALLLHDDHSPNHMREALLAKRVELSDRIAQEQARLKQIEISLTELAQTEDVPGYQILLKQAPSRLAASVRGKLSSYEDAGDLFVELDRHLKKHNASGQRGAIWHTCTGHAEYIDCEAVILLNRAVPGNQRVKVYELPASTDACVIHHGSDETITLAYQAAARWIRAHGYAKGGPLTELYWHDESLNITEIRYPILEIQPNDN
jgi:DNA-binding transcriptional MerR regulator